MGSVVQSVVGGGVVSGLLGGPDILGLDLTGKRAMGDAMGTQEAYTREALGKFDPYSKAGIAALAGLEKPNIDVTKDPSYQFRLNEAMKALTAGQAARGRAVSGAAMKELGRYSSDYASQEYGKAYDREMGRLSNLAGMGFNAAQGSADLVSALGQAKAGARMAQGQQQGQMLGNIAQIGGTIAGLFSDERVKTNIEPLNKADIEEMKKHLKAYAFNYTSDEFGKGDWIGVMAQDLEKSKLGRTLVIEKNGLKTIDTNKVLSMFLATMAEG